MLITMWWALYQVLLWFVYPFVRLRLYWRSRRSSAYAKGVDERFGWVPHQAPRAAIWIHCVSAGETIAAAPLIKRLLVELQRQARDTGGEPRPIIVTTMTPTGREQVKRLLGEQVFHCYAPYDFRFAVARFLQRAKPSALLLLETEIWPNLVSCSKALGLPVMLLNARLSDRSARSYRRLAGLIGPVLSDLDWLACQYPADRERFIELGANADRISCVGNMKFDTGGSELNPAVDPAVAAVAEWAGAAGTNCWVAGSTHAGEETIVLAAHAELLKAYPGLRLILVPRHPERFDSVVELCASYRTLRLSALQDASLAPEQIDTAQIVVGDRMGVLAELYRSADVAFIGGSLVRVGGHNPIEAANESLPILMGPHRFNFTSVCEAFIAAGAIIEVRDATSLAAQVRTLLDDPTRRASLGAAGRQVVLQNSGSTELLLEGILARLEAAKVAVGKANTERPKRNKAN